MRERLAEELALLRRHYGGDVEYRECGDWFLIPRYPTPAKCTPSLASVCFGLKPGYPGIEPYGFFAATDLLFEGQPFSGTSAAAPPPFPGSWTFFSWSPEGWFGTGDLLSGSNLWAWARSFAARLLDGPK